MPFNERTPSRSTTSQAEALAAAKAKAANEGGPDAMAAHFAREASKNVEGKGEAPKLAAVAEKPKGPTPEQKQERAQFVTGLNEVATKLLSFHIVGETNPSMAARQFEDMKDGEFLISTLQEIRTLNTRGEPLPPGTLRTAEELAKTLSKMEKNGTLPRIHKASELQKVVQSALERTGMRKAA